MDTICLGSRLAALWRVCLVSLSVCLGVTRPRGGLARATSGDGRRPLTGVVSLETRGLSRVNKSTGAMKSTP